MNKIGPYNRSTNKIAQRKIFITNIQLIYNIFTKELRTSFTKKLTIMP